MAAAKVHATAGDGTLCCGAQASSSMGPDFERLKFQGAGCWLAAGEQPRAGSALEPARPETASNTPWDLTPRSTAFQPDE
jgi:hypothetical protein